VERAIDRIMPAYPILVLNSGSSSIKFSLWEADGEEPRKLFEGAVEGIGQGESGAAVFWIKSSDESRLVDEKPQVADSAAAFALIAAALDKPPFQKPVAIGHRMVCGGPTVVEHQLLTPELIDEMVRYTAFAPLHTPSETYIMRRAMSLFPDVPNFVCLDSRFHRDLPEATRHLPIPEEYNAMGLRRFGAHGLSYESIVTRLGGELPERVIAAHLGNGASVCAIRDGRSVDTSMGLTPTGGIISGSRTGDIDPGVMVFLLREIVKGDTSSDAAADELEAIVNKQSGLVGLSGLGSDMRALRKATVDGNSAAQLAIDEFVYVLRKYIGAYFAVLGGLDLLVFTGGIGEHDVATRAEVCAGMEAMGILLDADRNRDAKGWGIISAEGARVTVQVLAAAEDETIVKHVKRLLDA